MTTKTDTEESITTEPKVPPTSTSGQEDDERRIGNVNADAESGDLSPARNASSDGHNAESTITVSEMVSTSSSRGARGGDEDKEVGDIEGGTQPSKILNDEAKDPTAQSMDGSKVISQEPEVVSSDTAKEDSKTRASNEDHDDDELDIIDTAASQDEENVIEVVGDTAEIQTNDIESFNEVAGDHTEIGDEENAVDVVGDNAEIQTNDIESEDEENKKSRLIVVVALLLIAAIGIGVWQSLSKDHDEQSKDHDKQRRKQEITEFLLAKNITKGGQLDNELSPQAKVVEFLASEEFDNSALSDAKLIERYVMAVWYYATNGPKWRNQTNFLTPEDTCGWHSWIKSRISGNVTKEGVICDTPEGESQPVVRMLHMAYNLLEGAIPSELKYLSNSLEQMHVGFNPGLEGEIPIAFAELTKLSSLELHYCAITGTIPEWLGAKLPLKRLILSNNLLTGSIPTSLLQQTNLQTLALDDNGLTGNIQDFGPLIKMQYLYIEDNLIQGQLTNQLLANWTAMTEMDFSGNDISGNLPSDLFTRMTNLEIVDLHGNVISGPLPDTIGDISNRIVFLALHDNRLSGEIPVELSNMIDLQHLDLSRNEFAGTIPSEIGKLSLLHYLFLGSNSYDAQKLPSELAQLTSLRELSIKKANLQGILPVWMANFTSLQLLDLDQNNFQGPIPSEMGDALSSLVYLLLNRNALTGTIPDTFAKLTDLDLLLLDHNNLTGSADVICNIPDLRLYVTDCDAVPSTANPDVFEAPEIECKCCSTCCHAQNFACNMYDWNANLDPMWEYGYTRQIYVFSQNLIDEDLPEG